MIFTTCCSLKNTVKKTVFYAIQILENSVYKGHQNSRNQMFVKAGVIKLETSRKINLASLLYKRALDPDYLDKRQLVTNLIKQKKN